MAHPGTGRAHERPMLTRRARKIRERAWEMRRGRRLNDQRRNKRSRRPMTIELRPATPDDAPALLAIYAPYVERTAVSFEAVPPSVDE